MARLADVAASAWRGPVLRFHGDPGDNARSDAAEYWPDGLLYVVDGHIAIAGPADQVASRLPAHTRVVRHHDALLVAGFIDTHIHYPQLDVIAAGGRSLLDWLRDYTFPEEERFADAEHAAGVAEAFVGELMRNGTTTAHVFCTVHPASVDALFGAAHRRGLRMIAGKVLMDRNAPTALLDDARGGIADSRRLLDRWHGRDRLLYSITPRFAATSSAEQLAAAGALAAEYPDVFIHSHLAENRAEIDWVRRLFPERESYLDVYAHHGLVRRRAVYAHCIHLSDDDRSRMARAGAAAAFCPTSNLYLGSGLFDLAASDRAGLPYSVATDVGGGTSFSPLQTLGDAHKVAQLSGQHLSPLRAFYLASRGAARCLDLEHCIGTLAEGSEADFVLLDLAATPLVARRSQRCRTLAEKLHVLTTLGDDRAIGATIGGGRIQHLSPRFAASHGPA